MPVEIERKFIANPSVLALCREGTHFVQGYLFTDAANTIRIRRAGARTLITWKSPRRGACRDEIEFAIPPEDGAALLATVPPDRRLEKTRYRVVHAGATWDVDVFGGGLSGLILAEIELEREDQPVVLPPWVEGEVTGDARYRNSRLSAGLVPERQAA
ncbi:CYTH domain-containing protein [Methylobacterium sp. 092160098-2]|uniref:CYTH domain-containing protein n=1 Tax=Methylobacterium sp. 092160098-2 TaxID=3025129 RepID=UPI002381A058|nr:CYTH domain-containing protein [Methylobacterium sp. 092160098-2]MDE4911139.1 CYTH domain-containing protein [Methylobacterium sp. 092160098-2]